MSDQSSSFNTTGGHQPINKINISESVDYGGSPQKSSSLLPKPFPNIRRKKKVGRTERERFLQTFEERSTFNVKEVDLGFLERKRIVLKKKQELLNKTLLANKNKNKDNAIQNNHNSNRISPVKENVEIEKLTHVTESIPPKNTVTQPVLNLKGIHTPKNESPQEENGKNEDQNFERTSIKPNETKTTINFNIYNAEIDKGNLKGENQVPRNGSVSSPTDAYAREIGNKPLLKKSQSIDIDDVNLDEKTINKPKREHHEGFEEEAQRNGKNLIRNVLCCQTLYSIVIYALLFVLIGVSAFFAFKTFELHKKHHHPSIYNHDNKHLHDSKRTNITFNNTLSMKDNPLNSSSEYQAFSDRLKDFFVQISNATLEKTKEIQEQKKEQDTLEQLSQNSQLNNNNLNTKLNIEQNENSAKTVNEKRQKIPGIPLIRVLIPTTPTTPVAPIAPTTTIKKLDSTPKPMTPGTTQPLVPMSTSTTVNPFLEAARNVLSSLNIGNLSPQTKANFNAGSIDLGDSTGIKNSPQAASVDQQPQISPTQGFEQQNPRYGDQPNGGFDDQNMFMDNRQSEPPVPTNQWGYESNYQQPDYDQNRLESPYGKSFGDSSVPYRRYQPPQSYLEDPNYGGQPKDDGDQDLRSFDPFKDRDQEVDDPGDGLTRRSNAADESPKTSITTTTSTTTPQPTTTTPPPPPPPPLPPPPPPPQPPSTAPPINPPTEARQPDPPRGAPLVIAENVEQYMSPSILSHDPLENMERNIKSDSVIQKERPMDEADDDDNEDESIDEETHTKPQRLSYKHEKLFPTRHTRGNDFKETDDDEIMPFDKDMKHGEKGDGLLEDDAEDKRPHHRHLIPIEHKVSDDDLDNDLKLTVSKLKTSLADDLKDIRKKFSKMSQTKDLDDVERMIKILHHDSNEPSDDAVGDAKDKKKIQKSDAETSKDDVASTLKQQQNTDLQKPDDAGKNLMSLMLSQQKKIQAVQPSPTPDLMSEFVAFEKSKIESKTAKRKDIPPKKKKKSKTEVKTYKLKTCVQIKAFSPGTLVQIVQGPDRIENKIKYNVRACTRKRKKRKLRMTCEDITYRISTGRLSVKPVGWENGKKVYAVFGCKSNGNHGAVMDRVNKKQMDRRDQNDMEMLGGDDSGEDNGDADNDGDDGDDDESGSTDYEGQDKNNEEYNDPMTVDVMKEANNEKRTKPKTNGDGKQIKDLMNMVTDMKKEMKKQAKNEVKLVNKVDDLKKSTNNDDVDNSDDLMSEKDSGYKKRKASQRTNIEDRDRDDDDDDDGNDDRQNEDHKRKHHKDVGDGNNEDDSDSDDNIDGHYKKHNHKHQRHPKDDGNSDDDEDSAGDGRLNIHHHHERSRNKKKHHNVESDNIDDSEGNEDSEKRSNKRRHHKDESSDRSDDDNDDSDSSRKRHNNDRDDEGNQDDENESSKQTNKRRRSKNRHKTSNDDNDDDFSDNNERHSRATRTPLHDNDDDDEHDEDFMRHQRQQQSLDDQDDDETDDDDDQEDDGKHADAGDVLQETRRTIHRADRSTIPYNSPNRKMEDSPETTNDLEDEEDNENQEKNQEDSDEENETQANVETPNMETSQIHQLVDYRGHQRKKNRLQHDPRSRKIQSMATGGQRYIKPQMFDDSAVDNSQQDSEDLMSDQSRQQQEVGRYENVENEQQEQTPREMVFNGVKYIMKDHRDDPTNTPNQITYNGVNYIVKGGDEQNEKRREEDGFQRFSDNNGEDLEFEEGREGQTQNIEATPSPFETIPLLPPTTKQPSESSSNNNIAEVIKAILPEVVRTIKEANTPIETKQKRDYIPTIATTTTALPTTPTTLATTTTRPPIHAPKKEDTSSQIDFILSGLKALGIGKLAKKDKEVEDPPPKVVHVKPATPPLTPAPPTPEPRTKTPRPTTSTPTPKIVHLQPPNPHLVNLHDPRQIRILCFGDSLTAGYNKHGKSFFPYCSPLGNILRYHSHLNIYTEAKGIVGEMAHKQMTHRLPLVLGNATMQYDWIIILGGTNDILHVKNFGDDDEFLNQLETIWQPRITKDIERLHEIAYQYGAHTMLLTVPENSIEAWPDYRPLFKMREKINESLRDFAYGSNSKTVLCDLAKKVPRHSLTPVMENMIWDDHLHMTPQGYTKMAQSVFECLKPYLPNTNK